MGGKTGTGSGLDRNILIRAFFVLACIFMPLMQFLNLRLVSDGAQKILFSDIIQALSAFAAFCGSSIVAARVRKDEPADFRGWVFISAAMFSWTVGMLGFGCLEVVLKVAPYPGWPDIFFLMFYPLMAVGLISLPAPVLERKEIPGIILEILSFCLITFLVFLALAMDGTLANILRGTGLDSKLSLLYMTFDVSMILVLLVILFIRLSTGVPFVPMLLLVLGCFFLVGSDFIQAQRASVDNFVSGGMVDIGWVAFASLVGLAAMMRIGGYQQLNSSIPGKPRNVVRLLITYFWLLIMIFILIRGTYYSTGSHRTQLIAGTITVIILLVIRQVLALVQNEMMSAKITALNVKLNAESVNLERANKVLRESSRKLKQAISFKDRLFSIIAHDLNNPIQVIMMTSEVLRLYPGEMKLDSIRNAGEDIFQATRGISDLLSNLLAWARSESGTLEYNPRPYRLCELVEKSGELYRQAFAAKGIEYRQRIPDKIVVKVDRNMTETVIRNLVSNAVKFTPMKGTISVMAVVADGEARVTVEDNGCGLTFPEIEKLFKTCDIDPEARRRSGAGSGLGLILCKDFISRSGGRIWVESEPGHGSRFHFTLPLG